MSISSEITRISGNVSDALTAIANKGVTVPSGSNSDDLATLIAQISSGGTGAITITDTTDSHGGTIREITGIDISDTTATASDVASGKYFYTAAGTKTQGTYSGPSGTKNISITSNGTTTENVTSYASASISVNVPNSYSSSDEGKVVSNGALVSQTSDTVTTNGTVDTTLINSLTVSVPTGGSSKLVQGSFTTNSSTGAQTVSINYSGSGYPIAACVYIDGGMRSDSTFNSLVQRYTIGQSTLVKAYTATSPTYSSSGDENVGIVSYVYKNSTSDATVFGASALTTANTYTSSNANSTAGTAIRFLSKNSISVYVKGSSGYGFAASTTYHYDIIYSA